MRYSIEFQYENNSVVVRFENGQNYATALKGLTEELTKESLEEFIKNSYQEILDTDEREREKQEKIRQLKESVKDLETEVHLKEFEIDENKEIKEVKTVKATIDEPV